MIMIERQSTKIGYKVKAIFNIHLNCNDLPLLQKIQAFFGGIGLIHIAKTGKSASFKVQRLNDLKNVIIPHFKSYPLWSEKNFNFELWLQCVKLMENKQHLTQDGFNKILSLKSALNLGLSDNLQSTFPNIVPIERPAYSVSEAPFKPNWISGFTEGEGSFFVSISQTTNQVRIFYSIGLNNRETLLIKKIQEFFSGIGNISYYTKNKSVQYVIVNVKDLSTIIVPHFYKFGLRENKLHNYLI
jgi:LAGLIDADG endonuclease